MIEAGFSSYTERVDIGELRAHCTTVHATTALAEVAGRCVGTVSGVR